MRRLRKSAEKKLFGVAGGVADYLDMDPTLVRVGFVALAIATSGLGLVVYIAMALLMPSAAPAAPGASEERPILPDSSVAHREDAPVQRNMLVWGLVGLGIFILVSKFNVFSIVNGWMLPVLLIGAGVFLLARRSKEA